MKTLVFQFSTYIVNLVSCVNFAHLSKHKRENKQSYSPREHFQLYSIQTSVIDICYMDVCSFVCLLASVYDHYCGRYGHCKVQSYMLGQPKKQFSIYYAKWIIQRLNLFRKAEMIVFGGIYSICLLHSLAVE